MTRSPPRASINQRVALPGAATPYRVRLATFKSRQSHNARTACNRSRPSCRSSAACEVMPAASPVASWSSSSGAWPSSWSSCAIRHCAWSRLRRHGGRVVLALACVSFALRASCDPFRSRWCTRSITTCSKCSPTSAGCLSLAHRTPFCSVGLGGRRTGGEQATARSILPPHFRMAHAWVPRHPFHWISWHRHPSARYVQIPARPAHRTPLPDARPALPARSPRPLCRHHDCGAPNPGVERDPHGDGEGGGATQGRGERV